MTKFCKQCHLPVVEDAPEGLCSQCLAKVPVGGEAADGGIEAEAAGLAEAETPASRKRIGGGFWLVLAGIAIIVGGVAVERHGRVSTNAAQPGKTQMPPVEASPARPLAAENATRQDLPGDSNQMEVVKASEGPRHITYGKDKPARTTEHGHRVVLEFVKADSEETSGEAGYGANAVDDDPDTIWHTKWLNGSPALPHEIIIELLPPSTIEGFTYLPRQDESDHGTIKDYEFYVSNDGKDFGRPVKKGTFEAGKEKKTETFEAVKCRYIKLRAISEINGLPLTSAAEIGVVQSSEDPPEKNGR
jgi:hypothetical protein